MKLLIKNMVCPRCIIVIKQLLSKHGLKAKTIFLGEIDLTEKLSNDQLKLFSADLEKVGFELLIDRKKQQCETIKNLLIQKVQEGDIENHFSVRTLLITALHKDYSLISRLFTECEKYTIEQFYIFQKLEKAKEWLQYNQFSIAEIASRLGYSSSQHFSSQFKKATGHTPVRFRTIAAPLRQPIDGIITDKSFA